MKVFYTLLSIVCMGSSFLKASDLDVFNSGLELEVPLIRMPLEDYVEGRAGKPIKLILGEGHINDVQKLPKEFLSHEDSALEGVQALTWSLLDEGYEHHRNEGFYTASAEAAEGFASDWAGNLRNAYHRRSLFPPETYDLIFDATYTPNALCADLFKDIAVSLRPGGYFIMTLSVTLVDGRYMCGHEAGEHELLWYRRAISFGRIGGVADYWRSFLEARGFSSIRCYEAPVTSIINELYTSGAISTPHIDDFTEADGDIVEERLAGSVGFNKKSVAAEIEPHLAHYTLSTYYLVARKYKD